MNYLSLVFLATLSASDVFDLAPGQRVSLPLEGLKAGATYRIGVNLDGLIGESDRVQVELAGPGSFVSKKTLHAGDPDFHLPFRPTIDGRRV